MVFTQTAYSAPPPKLAAAPWNDRASASKPRGATSPTVQRMPMAGSGIGGRRRDYARHGRLLHRAPAVFVGFPAAQEIEGDRSAGFRRLDGVPDQDRPQAERLQLRVE